MQENIYYHIHHRLNDENKEKNWVQGSKILVGNEYNNFYKESIEKSHAKFPKYEDLNNVPWHNVYEYLYNSGELYYEKNYEMLLKKADEIIREYQMLLREITYEQVRKDMFPDLPSRTKCIWLCKEKQLEFWKKQLNDCYFKIFKIEVKEKPYKTNNNLIVPPSESYIRIQEFAERYWTYKDETEKEDDEYLYVGEIEILEEI